MRVWAAPKPFLETESYRNTTTRHPPLLPFFNGTCQIDSFRLDDEHEFKINGLPAQERSLMNHTPYESYKWMDGRNNWMGVSLRQGCWGFRRRRTFIPQGMRTAFRAEGERSRSVATLAV